jgi:hypothetical protein
MTGYPNSMWEWNSIGIPFASLSIALTIPAVRSGVISHQPFLPLVLISYYVFFVFAIAILSVVAASWITTRPIVGYLKHGVFLAQRKIQGPIDV